MCCYRHTSTNMDLLLSFTFEETLLLYVPVVNPHSTLEGSRNKNVWGQLRNFGLNAGETVDLLGYKHTECDISKPYLTPNEGGAQRLESNGALIYTVHPTSLLLAS